MTAHTLSLRVTILATLALVIAFLAAAFLLVGEAAATDYPVRVQAARQWAQRTLGHVQFRCLDSIIAHESGWNPRAGSLTSSYGLAQAWPASKYVKYAKPGEDWRTDPMVQTRFAVAYVKSRYGSACNAWAHWQRWSSY